MNQNIRSGVLYYVVFVLIIIWIICLGILLVWYLNFTTYNLQLQADRLNDDMNSAMSLICAKPDSFQYNKASDIALFSDNTSKITAQKELWGFFDIIYLTGQVKNYSKKQIYQTGVDLDRQEKIALYMADENKYLTICGKSELTGNCYLPKSGIRRGYIEGKTYSGKNLVNGITKTSKTELPQTDKKILEKISNYLSDFKPDSLDSVLNVSVLLKKRKVINSFAGKTIYFISNDGILLSNKEIAGNIIIISSIGIKVQKNCRLNNIILAAPRIVFNDRFTGQLQAFATDTLIVGKNCIFFYPTALSIINDNVNNCYFQIFEKSAIDGIIYITQDKKAQRLPLLIIDSEVSFNGQLYCNGIVKLKGAINGSLYCKRFILETRSSIYENHLLDNRINRNKLSKHFAGINLTDSSGFQTKIIQCLK
jgi:hypothetical protein